MPLAMVLPLDWGWENGVLENLQVLLLFMGFCAALRTAWKQRVQSTRFLWWAISLIWLILAGRELAWGAAFLPPMGFGEHGPVISSRVLWYRPAVPWVCAALLLLGGLWMWHGHVWSTVIVRLQRERAWPLAALAFFGVFMLLSGSIEARGGEYLPQLSYGMRMLAEEIFETWGYGALCLAQWRVIEHTTGWLKTLR